MQDDVEEAWEHQSEAHSGNAANQGHDEREVGQKYCDSDRERHKEHAQYINDDALSAGQLIFLVGETWWHERHVGLLDYGEQSERRQGVGQESVQTQESIGSVFQRARRQIPGDFLLRVLLEGQNRDEAVDDLGRGRDQERVVHDAVELLRLLHRLLDRGQKRMAHKAKEDDTPRHWEACWKS